MFTLNMLVSFNIKGIQLYSDGTVSYTVEESSISYTSGIYVYIYLLKGKIDEPRSCLMMVRLAVPHHSSVTLTFN